MSRNTRQYRVIELNSGMKGICKYDRIGAIVAAHDLNKMYPDERWTVCAV